MSGSILNVLFCSFRGRSFTFAAGVLAEIASCQVEYAYLGKITGKKEHVDHVRFPLLQPLGVGAETALQATLITNLFYAANLSESGGMYPTGWNLNTSTPSDCELLAPIPAQTIEHTTPVHLSVGATADSGHEYTLKQFLLTARTDKRNLEMCPSLARTWNR
jgi:hypothetical protein